PPPSTGPRRPGAPGPRAPSRGVPRASAVGAGMTWRRRRRPPSDPPPRAARPQTSSARAANDGTLLRMNQAQARDLHEASIVSPQLRNAMLEGGESDLQVEDAGTGDVEIDGEL